MAKVKLNVEQLIKLIPVNEELNKFITNDELVKLVNDNLNKDNILNNSMMYFTEYKEVLFDVYKRIKIYVDVYSDITKIYSLKTCKVKQNIINPYNIRIAIYYNSEPLYFYIKNENIRTYKIDSIEA